MLSIPVAFIFLACALLWVIVGCRGHWILKLAMTGLTVLIACCIEVSLSSYQGHPKDVTLSQQSGKEMLLIAVRIDEPTAIYFWVLPRSYDHGWLAYIPEGSAPESYRFPYSRQLHEAAQAASQDIIRNGGQPVPISIRPQSPLGGSVSSTSRTSTGSYEIYRLPPAPLPAK